MVKYILQAAFFLIPLFFQAQRPVQPAQPFEGPGGSEYVFEDILVTDSSWYAGGFWVFQPGMSTTDSLPVVIFFHGFGCYNPMIYGEWIRHLVRKGNVVVMPRYQERLLRPRSGEFSAKAAQGVRRGIEALRARGGAYQTDRPVFIGHSYGAVLAADLAQHYDQHGIPKPAGVMLCQAGTNIFKGGRLKEFDGFSKDLKMMIVLAKNDLLVGRGFSKKVFRATAHLENRDMLMLAPDGHGRPRLLAGHRACHAPDLFFDNGVRTFSARYALFHTSSDAADFFCFWKLGDALINCTLKGTDCESVFGHTIEQYHLGEWSDGKPIRPLQPFLPE